MNGPAPGVLELVQAYRSGADSPFAVVDRIYSKLEDQPLAPVWISVVSRDEGLARARELERDPRALALPLYGVPFAIKDNIHVAGMFTTAGCPDFGYAPTRTAHVVERLIAAGAILIDKTNMDQFATGLPH